MARLRVRIELNRGGVGVPLHKLASVAEESQRFLQMLAQDVRIDRDQGEWLAFDFDQESLNFTAEYIGPVSPDQVRAFCAAFDGVTSLRRATIAQFTRIADAIDEDELIGFGLYASGHETEPSEWRCLSRRDALRIADEIQLLLGASGELDQETRLPAVMDNSQGARLFRERHERKSSSPEQFKLPNFIRDVEANLSRRIDRIEGEVETHSQIIGELRENSATVEESVRSLLTSVEGFCGQATREVERFTVPQLPAPIAPANSGRKRKATIVAAVVGAGIVSSVLLLWPSKSVQTATAVTSVEAVEPVKPSPVVENPSPPPEPPKPLPKAANKRVATVPAAVETTEASSEPMHIELEAREPAWVSITDAEGKNLFVGVLQSNELRTLDLTKSAVLRTGNAGGLDVRVNGKEIGQIGPTGKIREIEFQNGAFKIRQPAGG